MLRGALSLLLGVAAVVLPQNTSWLNATVEVHSYGLGLSRRRS